MPEVSSGRFIQGTEILQIPGQQMGRLAGGRGLEDRLIFLCETRGRRAAGCMFDEPDGLGQSLQDIQGIRILPRQIPAGFLQGIAAGVEIPMALPSEIDDQRRFAARVVCRRKQDIGVEETASFLSAELIEYACALTTRQPVRLVPFGDLLRRGSTGFRSQRPA